VASQEGLSSVKGRLAERYKSPGIYQIPSEQIQAEEEILRSEIHQPINSIWSREELPEHWKETLILPIYKKGDETDCSNYRGLHWYHHHTDVSIQHLLEKLSPYVDEFIADHGCCFPHNTSITYQVSCIPQSQ
jgi:hypothetical protein